MNVVRALVRGFLGLVLLAHGLIHLIMPPAWNGTSPLLSGLLGGEPLSLLIDMLLGATVICYAVAAGGIVHFPVARNVWTVAGVIGSLTSLAMFALMWGALSPDSATFMYGPIVSFIVMVPVSFYHWKVRGPLAGPLTTDVREAQ